MATTKKEETSVKVTPVLKKRTSPDELVSMKLVLLQLIRLRKEYCQEMNQFHR